MAPFIGKVKAAVNSGRAYASGLRHLFHKPYTLRFPEQRYAVEQGYRGRHLLHLDRCTGCGICAWICPEKCITIVQRGDRWFPQYFYGRCCFCHFCVTPETLVTTNPSITPIGQLQAGDRVLTHTGQYRPVRQVLTRNYSGKLYSIKPMGAPHSLNVTADHPLLVAPRRYVKRDRLDKKPAALVWKTPTELKQGDYLTMPILKETRDFEFYEQEVTVGQPSTGRKLSKKLRLETQPDLFRLIGYYLAEGHITRRTVGFTFGSHEQEYIADASRLLEKFFSRDTKRSHIHNATQVLLHSVVGLQFFQNFGRGADIKMMPDWVMFAPPEKQRELVKGAWRGDGYLHTPTTGNRATFFEYVTTSRTLAFQIQQVLFRQRIVAQVSFTQHRERKPAYVITVRGRFVQPMSKLMGHELSETREKTFSRLEIDNNYVYAPIQKIETRDVSNQPVVNLSVEGDESYVAGNITAHNCTDYCPEFALEETVEYDIAEYSRELLVWSPERLAKAPAKKDDKYVFDVDGRRGASQVVEKDH